MSIPNINKVMAIFKNYSDSCTKCLSTNISNEDDSDEYTCHDCSYQFTEDDMKDKIHIIAILRTNNQIEAAKKIEQMSSGEYESFKKDYLEDDFL